MVCTQIDIPNLLEEDISDVVSDITGSNSFILVVVLVIGFMIMKVFRG